MYVAPVDEIAFTLKRLAGLGPALDDGMFGDISEDLTEAVLHEAGRFASERIAPLNRVGDRHGAPCRNGVVTMPPGWREVYQEWCEAGWNALAGSPDYGGQGLPTMLAVATTEMWNSASMAFGLGPLLTVGAVEALTRHGSPELKDKFLPRLVTGEWMGTMNLTEPHAGSDLGTLRTKAEPAGDGTYRLFGQKIFITYGEHDLTRNICHLVLARLPDAPPGTAGISLFLVPKLLLKENGEPGPRNDVFCQSVEEKLGIHASPTCVMVYGDGRFGETPGAVGYLIGEENRGLACMFTMMNNARLNVGIQGVAVAEAAFQQALTYAKERRQGRAPGWDGPGMSPIIAHPDVRRMLATMQSNVRAARAICYNCAHAIDMARISTGEAAEKWRQRADLLTPVAKAFSTDIGWEVASLGVQIHGGMGYIEETGAAQLLRDARIAMIYEGTNGIQAIDLVTRKLPLAGGDAIASYIAELRAEAARAAGHLGNSAQLLHDALDHLSATSEYLLARLEEADKSNALAAATPYLRLFGLTAGGVYLAKGAAEDPARAGVARYFAGNHLAECHSLASVVRNGSASPLDGSVQLELQ